MTGAGVIAAFIDPLIERSLKGGHGWKNNSPGGSGEQHPDWGGETMHASSTQWSTGWSRPGGGPSPGPTSAI